MLQRDYDHHKPVSPSHAEGHMTQQNCSQVSRYPQYLVKELFLRAQVMDEGKS